MGQYSTSQLVSLIQNTASAYGIDPNIAVEQLRWESGNFNPLYVYGPGKSSASAMGIAQFIWATGNRYGLRTVDDFYNPDLAVPAWARYMRHLLDTFGGRYDLALAGYNTGEGRAAVKQAYQNGDSVLNYGILPETYTYVSTILSNAGYDPSAMPVGNDSGNALIDDGSGNLIPDPLIDDPEGGSLSWLIAALVFILMNKR